MVRARLSAFRMRSGLVAAVLLGLAVGGCTVTTSGDVRYEVTNAPRPGSR